LPWWAWAGRAYLRKNQYANSAIRKTPPPIFALQVVQLRTWFSWVILCSWKFDSMEGRIAGLPVDIDFELQIPRSLFAYS